MPVRSKVAYFREVDLHLQLGGLGVEELLRAEQAPAGAQVLDQVLVGILDEAALVRADALDVGLERRGERGPVLDPQRRQIAFHGRGAAVPCISFIWMRRSAKRSRRSSTSARRFRLRHQATKPKKGSTR